MEWLSQFGGILGTATLFVGAGVYLYSLTRKGQQDVIRVENADLRASNQELRAREAAAGAKIEEQQRTIAYLKEIATQTPAVTKLIDVINEQQKQSGKQHIEVITGLTTVANGIGDLVVAINESNKRNNP